MSYGTLRRRSRAGLVSLGYRRQGGYPIATYPIEGSAPVYSNPKTSYGSPEYSEKGLAWLIPLVTAGASAVSNYVLNSDQQAANAAAIANQQQIDAIEAANKPYILAAGVLVTTVVVFSFASIVKAKIEANKS